MTTWHILTCLSQRERTVAADLRESLDLLVYVPIEIQRHTLRGVAHERRRALMPGYVFAGVRGGVMPWRGVRDVRHVLGWLEIDGSPAALSDAHIDHMRLMEKQHSAALTQRRVFRVGDRVRPASGPFASIDVLLSSLRGSQAIIEVHMLGSTRKASISVDQLEKVA